MLICSSPRLIAACHVLHRLLMPRHSPYALVRLNFLLYDSMIILGSRSLNCLSFSLSSRSAELSFRIILTLLRCEKAIRLLHFVFEFHLSVKLFSLTIWKDSIISYFVLFCSFSYSNLSSIRLSKISAQLFSESDRFAFSVSFAFRLLPRYWPNSPSGEFCGRSGWTRTIDLALIRRAL